MNLLRKRMGHTESITSAGWGVAVADARSVRQRERPPHWRHPLLVALRNRGFVRARGWEGLQLRRKVGRQPDGSSQYQ